MFGPNTHTIINEKLDFSHRDVKFMDLFQELNFLFNQIFKLNDYDLIFISGSGTLGVESIFWSSVNKINVIGPEGKFKNRWSKLAKNYNKLKKNDNYVNLFCALETSTGDTFTEKNCFIDAVSSFPFYDLPEDTKSFVTCSNKQLGSVPGICIVGVKKDSWEMFEDDSKFSYLNLARYKSYSHKNQTPSTPAYPIMQDLINTLKDFSIIDLRKRIEKNCLALGALFIIDKPSPVILIEKKKVPTKIAQKWDLYGINDETDYYSVFTYSCEAKEYKKFVEDCLEE